MAASAATPQASAGAAASALNRAEAQKKLQKKVLSLIKQGDQFRKEYSSDARTLSHPVGLFGYDAVSSKGEPTGAIQKAIKELMELLPSHRKTLELLEATCRKTQNQWMSGEVVDSAVLHQAINTCKEALKEAEKAAEKAAAAEIAPAAEIAGVEAGLENKLDGAEPVKAEAPNAEVVEAAAAQIAAPEAAPERKLHEAEPAKAKAPNAEAVEAAAREKETLHSAMKKLDKLLGTGIHEEIARLAEKAAEQQITNHHAIQQHRLWQSDIAEVYRGNNLGKWGRFKQLVLHDPFFLRGEESTDRINQENEKKLFEQAQKDQKNPAWLEVGLVLGKEQQELALRKKEIAEKGERLAYFEALKRHQEHGKDAHALRRGAITISFDEYGTGKKDKEGNEIKEKRMRAVETSFFGVQSVNAAVMRELVKVCIAEAKGKPLKVECGEGADPKEAVRHLRYIINAAMEQAQKGIYTELKIGTNMEKMLQAYPQKTWYGGKKEVDQIHEHLAALAKGKKDHDALMEREENQGLAAKQQADADKVAPVVTAWKALLAQDPAKEEVLQEAQSLAAQPLPGVAPPDLAVAPGARPTTAHEALAAFLLKDPDKTEILLKDALHDFREADRVQQDIDMRMTALGVRLADEQGDLDVDGIDGITGELKELRVLAAENLPKLEAQRSLVENMGKWLENLIENSELTQKKDSFSELLKEVNAGKKVAMVPDPAAGPAAAAAAVLAKREAVQAKLTQLVHKADQKKQEIDARPKKR